MPFMEWDWEAVWGVEGDPGPGFPYDIKIPDTNIVLNSNGEANLPIKVYNDQKSDGDNIFVLTIKELTSPASGFKQEIYEFKEADGTPLSASGSPQFDDKTFNIGLTTASSIQTAYIVIRDDEKPSRKTQGDNQNNTIDKRGTDNSDTSDDIIYAGAGDDIVDAGKSNDIVLGQQGNDTLRGQEGNDALFGGDGNDTLDGGTGNDKLYGEAGNDRLIGGDGNDYLDGGTGVDILEGGNGDDIYVIDNPNDQIIDSPGTGIETVVASVDWTLAPGLDHLTLTGSAIKGIGNSFNNNIKGNNKNNYLDGGEGNDNLYGYDGNDFLLSGDGDDKLYGGSGDDTLIGGDGNDILDGEYGVDTLEGGTGNDIYIVDNINDKIIDLPGTGIETVKASVSWTLGSGLDHLILSTYADGYVDSDSSDRNGTGNNLNNIITGNGGKNVLLGLGGDDTLLGGSGDDTLLGGDGNDTLIGGKGTDTITGGSGADKFVFESLTKAYMSNAILEGIDVIKDFNRSEGDKIQISKSGFGATSTIQFSYNSSTGALSFYTNPLQNEAPIQFATLQLGTNFSTSLDITLV